MTISGTSSVQKEIELSSTTAVPVNLEYWIFNTFSVQLWALIVIQRLAEKI